MIFSVVLHRPDSRGYLMEALANRLGSRRVHPHTNFLAVYDDFDIALQEVRLRTLDDKICMITGERMLDGGSGSSFAKKFKGVYPKGIFILFTQFSLSAIDSDNQLIDAVIAPGDAGRNPFDVLAQLLTTPPAFADAKSLKREHPAILLRQEIRAFQVRMRQVLRH